MSLTGPLPLGKSVLNRPLERPIALERPLTMLTAMSNLALAPLADD